MTEPTLAALLAEGAVRLEGATETATGQGTDFYLDDILFASLAGGVVEFRLREEVGAAALRTPDVKVSARGVGWVRFAPARLDGHARDRAQAWLESAWRRADAELSGIAGPGGDDLDDADAAELDDADRGDDDLDDEEPGAVDPTG